MHALMPITPFHFGSGAAIHAAAPRYVSFLAFCATNILMDVEPLYYILTQQYPLHRFFHTYIGASIVAAATVGLFEAGRRVVGKIPRLRAVAFNGATASKIGRRELAGVEGIELVTLPSSSPALAIGFDRKQAQWLPLKAYLG